MERQHKPGTKSSTFQSTMQGVNIVQRKCACGSPTLSLTGVCPQCVGERPLQKKLSIGTSNDPLEHQADRIADHVMANPARSSGSGALRIERFRGQPAGELNVAPPSVNEVLNAPG